MNGVNLASTGKPIEKFANSTQQKIIIMLVGISLLLLAGYTGIKNFLLFHVFTEGFTIVVSFSIALIVFNTHQNIKSQFIPILGIAYAFAGVFDTLHTLAYRGMGVFPDDFGNMPTQMWVIARYLDSIGMVIAGISFYKIIKSFYVLIAYAVVSAIILAAVYYWQVFPVAYIDGQGLTPFKVYSEYIICLILITSVVLLVRHKNRFQPLVYRQLLIFFLFSVCTEFSFTFYKTLSGWANVTGHLFKITAFFYLYRAVVVTSLQEPYDQVHKQARDLQDINATLEEEITERQAVQQELCQLNAALETRVLERTSELQDINAMLEEEVSERQLAEEALRQHRDALMASEDRLKHCIADLERTNKELQNFANIIAHDFRAPMVNLRGFAKELDHSLADLRQIIKESIDHLPEKVQSKADQLIAEDIPDSLQFIHSAVERLDRMVAALLKLAREGRRDMIYKEVDCSKLVTLVLRSFEHQIGQKNILVEVGPMPIIETDYLAMEQIIGNLLDNAIKYLDFARPGKIGIFCSDEGVEYLFSVQDNGRGIDSADCNKIFDVFRRVGIQDMPGEGMGLAYVKAIIRQLGGKVWCESEVGVGTKIIFTVPKRAVSIETLPLNE